MSDKMPLSEIRRVLERGEWRDALHDVSLDELNGAIESALDKLTEYETAEADGRLVRLPCKVGDTVYDVDSALILGGDIIEGIVKKIAYYAPEEYPNFNMVDIAFHAEDGDTLASVSFSCFGSGTYLTRAEAEAALQEKEAHHGRTTDETQC